MASEEVKPGDLVKIHYTIKVVEDGEEKVYATTREDVAKEAGLYSEGRRYGPVWVEVGKGRLIDALEKALIGMKVGEKKTVIAKPEEAYGEYDKSKVIAVSIKRLRAAGYERIQPGMEVKIGDSIGRVKRVTERYAYIDFNHPLAGKTLKIEVEVLEKAENDLEKAKAIALRHFGNAEVREEDGRLVIVINPRHLLASEFNELVLMAVDAIYSNTSYKTVDVVLRFELPRGEEGKQEAGGEEAGSGESGAAEASGG